MLAVNNDPYRFDNDNTAELRKKLEELGYKMLFSARNGYGSGLQTTFGGFVSSEQTENSIDCGDNEDLFLALAALREDTDKGQWFCDDNGLWEQTHSDLPSRYMQMHGHKATVPEILKHFNGTTN